MNNQLLEEILEINTPAFCTMAFMQYDLAYNGNIQLGHHKANEIALSYMRDYIWFDELYHKTYER